MFSTFEPKKGFPAVSEQAGNAAIQFLEEAIVALGLYIAFCETERDRRRNEPPPVSPDR